MTANNDDDIKSPIPITNKTLSQLKRVDRSPGRPSSSQGEIKRKRSRLFTSEARPDSPLRARSATPTVQDQKLFNGMDSTLLLNERLQHYTLDYVSDRGQHIKNIYDPNSRWFSRSVRPEFPIEEFLPYKTESHEDQAKYLCHVLVNLYIAISSLDIQGLISISSKDLADLKKEVDELALKTDLFRLSNNTAENDLLGNDIANYDDAEGLEDELDEYFDLTGPDFNATGKITAKSATIVNVNHWTNELKNCLHFDFPVALRKSLATVYYYLSLVQGQKVYRQMHVDMFERLVSTDDDRTNFTDLLQREGLLLDHQIMLDFLCEFLPYPDPDYARYELSSKEDLQLFRLLLKHAHNAKPFFDESKEDLLVDTMNFLLSSLAPSTMMAIMPIITSVVPYHYHIHSKIVDYFPFCYSIWSSVSANVAIDTHMYDFVGSISKDVHNKILSNDHKKEVVGVDFGKFGIFTDDQMTFMFNRLQGHLRTDGQIHSYSRTVKPFVYAINGCNKDKFFEKLLSLAKAIETFIHPSNNGFWTKPNAKFVHSFIKTYHGRVKYEEEICSNGAANEICLTSSCHEEIVRIFFNIVGLGSQNKNSDIANYYISCFAYLLELNPSNAYLIYDKILLDLYDTLSDQFINSKHRIISSLKQFTRIIRFIVMDKLYRVHITNVLSMLVSKLDMNDTNLTSNLINGIVSIAAFIPIKNLTNEGDYLSFDSDTLPLIEQHFYHIKSGESSKTFQIDEKLLNNAFIASTTIFESILKVYAEKVFQLIDVDLEDSLATKINQTTMILQESMDDKLFKYFADLLLRNFWSNDSFKEKDPNYELITIPLAAIVRRNNTLSKDLVKTLLFHVKEQIKRGAGSVRSTSEIQQRDVKLVLYLTTLNDVLRQCHDSLLDYSDELITFMKYLYDNVTNPPLDVITSIVIHSALATLCTTEITDCRLFPEDSMIPEEDRWGGLQFDPRRFEKQHLNFKWHVPSDDEITLSISILESLTDYCINKVEELMKTPRNDSEYGDMIQKYVLVMTHTLSGSSLLFDPDFSKYRTQSNLSYREKLILLKNIRENNCDAQELDIDIEQIRSVKDEEDYIESKDIEAGLNEGVSDVVQLRDEFPNELIVDDQIASEMPSGVNTPIAGSRGADNSSMSSDLAFRDLDIYSCNYYFGNTTEEKLQNPQYIQVHKVRALIGRFFHKLYTFLSTNFENNTNMFQILLHGLKVWFTDLGQETVFNEDPDAFIDVDFLENVQSLSHVNEPFTRTNFAIRANGLHQSRVLLHSTNRKGSKLENLLLVDIIHLATSLYPDIYKPAQGTLVHCMKQLVGSYGVVINKIIPLLEKAVKEHDYMKIQVILNVLLIKKIHRKLMTDYRDIDRLIFLLIECCHVNELEIGMYADKILTDIVIGIKIPSSVCVISDEAFLPLAPPDDTINLQVEAVKLAKKKKREYYLSLLVDLQNRLLDKLDNEKEMGWKIKMFIVRFVTQIQSSLESKPDKRAVSSIISQTATKHPEIIHLIVKSLLSICNKIISLSDYQYDITKAYKNEFNPSFVEVMSTSDTNFPRSFAEEMDNFENPEYFIDSRAFVGWLCWGRPVYVMSSKTLGLNLHQNELDVLMSTGRLVTKEFLRDVTMNLVQDNETRGVFSSGNVSFFSLIILLISSGFCKINLSELFELCESYYNKDDKASMIMSVEIVAGLICGSKFMTAADLQRRDAFIEIFLAKCLDYELNHDAFEIWSTLAWWLPAVVDLRRSKTFFNHFINADSMFDRKSDAATHQTSKIYMLRSILMSMEFRAPNVSKLFDELVVDHPYDQVRQAAAKLLTTLVQNQSNPSISNPTKLLEAELNDPDGLGLPLKRVPEKVDTYIKRQFESITDLADSVIGMSPQEFIKTEYFYRTSTMFYWIKEMARGPNKVLLVPYLVDYVLTFLIGLVKHKDVCALASLDPIRLYAGLGYMPVRKNDVAAIVDYVCSSNVILSSNQIKLQLGFIQHFLSAELLQLTEEEKTKILEFVVSNLYNEQFVEVRVRAASILSDIVHNWKEEQALLNLIDRFAKGLDVNKYSSKERQKLSKADIKIHGNVLGLGAIISAFPYVFPLPLWIPKQLSNLSSWARTSGMTGQAAKNTISEFKKVRADTWKFDRAFFKTEELEDLEGVLWRSYYA
ncbi:proteasome activator BLM10 SKDI_06G0610 [Saccharomyces kudriavzevii IFO 1802]|uniref:BLM10-like protein n=1 Tax=Saccharomyces kudriavzevii (strain ATCC MYA-4449 / AS 2.2408 / CBS 8840 / NBRC 1802 / NCYC 2889) TaxID=226230 RepID=A0AA35NRW4_SACK1|nr:uncharacterized protein SKDI_06G0610 [Saccharomyces kudriavzevii IFO 1802]CAI4060947.1 hypothetical protein SKDI_06G0610 [Saccharomyces kudriavzevii IFO 1802]